MSGGIVVKVWNITGDSVKKGTKAQLADSVGYILNSEKTVAQIELNPLDQLTRECKYVENDLKTFDGAYVGGHNVTSTDVSHAVDEMMKVKKFFDKQNGRAALHMLISLPEEESDPSNASRLMQLCSDVLKEIFPNNQAVFAVHTNTDNLHVHVIVNSVGLNGKKIHQDKNFVSKVLQPCVNKYANWYNFSPNSKWEKKESTSAYKYPQLKAELRNAVDLAIENADSFEEFLKNLNDQGVKVRVGKHISLCVPGQQKAIRTHNLGTNYTRDAIVEKIQTKREKFILADIGNYAATPTDDVFSPTIVKLKKYKDMTATEKKKMIRELRLGKNPWRENQKLSWQLNKIADDLNSFERVRSYVQSYSNDGSVQGALDAILEAKKSVAHDKNMIAYAMRKYHPIIKIYEEMKKLEKRSYLYEHENVEDYRPEFERYRELTRRLKNNYGKEIFEVADFMNECTERTLYARAQLNELSQQYRELKKYGLERGMITQDQDNFQSVIGFEWNSSLNQAIEMNSFYVSSVNTDVVLKIVKSVGQDSSGKNYQAYSISVMDSKGNIIDEINNHKDKNQFYSVLKNFQNKYELSTCKRFDQYQLAKEYSQQEKTRERNNTQQVIKSDAGIVEEKYPDLNIRVSFPQAVNHVYEDRPLCAITDSKTPSYIALSSIHDDQLKIEIINRFGQHQEEIMVPIVKNKNSDGYLRIVGLQKKYGFSDQVYEFDTPAAAKKYVSDTMRTKSNGKRKGL